MNIQKTLFLALLSIPLFADQGSLTNSGGSTSASPVYISSSVAAPAGTLTISGVSLSYVSTDGSEAINATLTNPSLTEGCSGGGRGGHVTCTWTYTGNFSGTLTLNGVTQAINGVTTQYFGTTGGAATGTTAYNSAYTPFYYSDSGQILRSDDIQGTNQITYGISGGGVGQFYGAYGIALDSAGRIYVADTYNCRIVRVDDMNGTNWISYGGTCGSGTGQFYDPSGIAVDLNGEIYVLDTGNARLVRMDDMNGTNWISYGSAGSGVGQFLPYYLAQIAVDSSGRIYVADTANLRIVRMDDIYGTNWTTLSSVQVGGVNYLFQAPVAIAFDAAGKIYVADNDAPQPGVVRVDDMTGANWTYLAVGGNGLSSIGVDSTGIVFAGGGGVRLVDGLAGVLTSSGSIGPYGTAYIFGVTPLPLPYPRPSALSFSPATLTFSQNVGTTSPAQNITISNFGGSPLNIFSISASGAFGQTNNCPSQLIAGTTCTVSVTFSPTATGPAAGTLNVTDDSGNLGGAQAVALSGTGTAPAATVTPTSLSFFTQVVGTTSGARNVTLQNTGTGPMNVASVTASAQFSQTNNCTSLAPTASCTIMASFSPAVVGSVSGTLTITDDAGTQSVTLSGTGSAPVTFSPNSLSFGSLAVGNTSAAKTVTVTNRLNVALSFASIATSGSFAVATNTCGSSIAAGANCAVGVTFTPTATGNTTGSLILTDSALTSPQTVGLSGTGTTPVTLSAGSLNLGTVAVGNTSAAKSVTLTNNQNVALNFTSIVASTNFNVSSTTCGSSIAAGARCTISVTFSPTALGAATGTLTITDDAANSPQTVNLSGTGSAPVTLSTTSLSFGTIPVGMTSSPKSVSLTNNQNVALSFTSIVTTANFNVASTTCGSSIAAGARCSISVTFSPTASGAATGTLTITDSAANSPQTVSLSGTGR